MVHAPRSLERDIEQLRKQGRPVPTPPHAEAEIRFLPSDEGGRTRPVYSGYRGQVFYDGHDWDAFEDYPDAEVVHPGDTVRALLTFVSPSAHTGKVYPGKEFEVREGPHLVGIGRITKIFDMQ